MSVDLMQDVVDFQEHFGLTYDHPLSQDRQDERADYMFEELEEYEICKEPHEKLDALIDLIYYTLGTIYAHGYAPVFAEAWRRVHASNMAKVRSPSASEERGRGNKWDVIKPQNWVAPDLRDLVS